MDDSIFNELTEFRNLQNKHEKASLVAPNKKLKPSEQLLEDIKAEGFEMSQMLDVLKTQGNQLIISCAGSGKTTVLVFKVIYDIRTGFATRVVEVNDNHIRTPEKIWVSTFLKSGAEELKYALRKWQNRLHCTDTSSAIQFSTLHAEFKRALNSMGIVTNIVSASDNTRYLKEVLKPYQLYNSNGKSLNSDDIRGLESAITYTRSKLGNDRYNHQVYDELNIGKTIIDAIIRDWKAMRIKNNVCDFEDLQEMLYIECYEKGNQEVIDFLASRYNFIYLDEFQDTSEIQYKLLKVYARGCKQVVAVGDDDQIIYSWRGSCNSIITKDFLVDFSPKLNLLSVNFRCPSKILNAIKPCIANNTVRFDKPLTSHREGGLVRYLPMPNYSKMVANLSELVYEDVKNGKTVAILCRVNSDGLTPALLLDKFNAFSYSISGEGMTLDSYIGRIVLSIVKLFTEKATQSVKNAIGLLTWESWSVNNLMKVLKSNKMSIWTVDEKDLSYSCPDIAEKVLQWRKWRKDLGDLQALRLVLQDYRVNVFQKDNQFNSVVKSVIRSVEALLECFNYDYIEDFESELEDINERLKYRIKQSNAKVRIATVHEFKGKEADSVYIWNASDEVFPSKEIEDTVNALEEERRLFYIACTRAKETSTLVYFSSKPSPFISEMDLSEAKLLEGTSSNVVGSIKSSIVEESNLNTFLKEAEKKEVEKNKSTFDDVFLPEADYKYYDENEFWGK